MASMHACGCPTQVVPPAVLWALTLSPSWRSIDSEGAYTEDTITMQAGLSDKTCSLLHHHLQTLLWHGNHYPVAWAHLPPTSPRSPCSSRVTSPAPPRLPLPHCLTSRSHHVSEIRSGSPTSFYSSMFILLYNYSINFLHTAYAYRNLFIFVTQSLSNYQFVPSSSLNCSDVLCA